jgi:hypothetical protein
MEDQEDAIDLIEKHSCSARPDHSLEPLRTNEKMEDCEEAIELSRETRVHLRPGHPACAYCLNNLARAVISRYELTWRMKDLEEAIELHLAALIVHPPGYRLCKSHCPT